MNLIVKKMTLLASLAVLTMSPVAMAGATSSSASCYGNWDGSGYCYGTFLGFRSSSQSSAYAYFYQSSGGSRSFSASYWIAGSTSYSNFSCVPDTTVAAMWDRAMLAQGYFSISWNGSGTCTALYLYNGSQYSNF